MKTYHQINMEILGVLEMEKLVAHVFLRWLKLKRRNENHNTTTKEF